MPARPARKKPPRSSAAAPRQIAVVGAGMAGIACARTLVQAGHAVSLFEREQQVGGRMASQQTPFGRFDTGAQYFTVRDARFSLALQTAPGLVRPWSANAVRVLDAHGRVAEAALPKREPHWVATPGMDALPAHWAAPLGPDLYAGTRVVAIERDGSAHWQLHGEDAAGTTRLHSGFDAVLLALPPASTRMLLPDAAAGLRTRIDAVRVAPCWTLMLAFPQASQPTLAHLGPQWNAALSTHHRVAWLARESSKPGREQIERWTLQASAAWSSEHLRDDAPRIEGKLTRAFGEITGIRATPAWTDTRLWHEAKTETPLGHSHLWDAAAGIGLAGDWCLGHRVEDAFVSGLSLALEVIG